uniref:Uncharacterized protein n=1 Tax=Knipowitschia caucasica TaxID=637954 RepID=A0AAV2JG80_KNICA
MSTPSQTGASLLTYRYSPSVHTTQPCINLTSILLLFLRVPRCHRYLGRMKRLLGRGHWSQREARLPGPGRTRRTRRPRCCYNPSEHIDPPVLQSAPGCAEHTTNNRNMPADRPCSTATENIPPASLSDHTTSTDCIITAHMDHVIRIRPASDHINKNSGDMENAGWIFACSALFQNISPLLN